jgi:hypothetical protein
LEQNPKAKIKVFVLWGPIRTSDNRRAAEIASGYLPDARSAHFWDLWSYGLKLYTTQLNFPANTLAWDIFVVYKPQVFWGNAAPEPTVWLQNLGLNHGTKYTPKLLQAELEKWIH